MFLPLLVALAFALYPSPVHGNQLPAVLVHIADCESGARQFTIDGKVVYNSKTHDYGYFQINRVHIKEAQAKGYDIMTEEGNISYALYLYYHEGTTPWNSSKNCWGAGGGSA